MGFVSALSAPTPETPGKLAALPAHGRSRRLISYRRGAIKTLELKGLEAATCGSYKADKLTYARTMGKAYSAAACTVYCSWLRS